MGHSSKDPQLYYGGRINILKEQHLDRQLVPFAKYEFDDTVACFEASPVLENPRIHNIKSFRSGSARGRDTDRDHLAKHAEKPDQYIRSAHGETQTIALDVEMVALVYGINGTHDANPANWR